MTAVTASTVTVPIAVEDGILAEIRRGLGSRPLALPSKLFYDDVGSELFDRICDLPEYYPTRTELALLEEKAAEIAALSDADELVELGSGTGRKTRTLLEAMLEREIRGRYVPVDISDYALLAAVGLEDDYPGLEVEGVRCDYTRDLDELPVSERMLCAFLGGTVGNFAADEAIRVLREVAERLPLGSWFLLGVDLVKPVRVLEAAYNDSRGVTAAFNRNILEVVNREADGDLDPADFDHLARFNAAESRIEMHLVARRPVRAVLERLDLVLEMAAGESILTEISRKFTRTTTAALLARSGFDLRHWFPAPDDAFALALAAVEG